MPESAPVTLLNVDDYAPGLYARSTGVAAGRLHGAGGRQRARRRCASPPSHKPALVLLDVNMPDMSGLEVCRRLKTDPETVLVLVLHVSATATRGSDRLQALEHGADTYLVEPVETEELIATVRALLRLRAAETALRERERQLQAILEHTPVVLFMKGADGRYLLANQGYERSPDGLGRRAEGPPRHRAVRSRDWPTPWGPRGRGVLETASSPPSSRRRWASGRPAASTIRSVSRSTRRSRPAVRRLHHCHRHHAAQARRTEYQSLLAREQSARRDAEIGQPDEGRLPGDAVARAPDADRRRFWAGPRSSRPFSGTRRPCIARWRASSGTRASRFSSSTTCSISRGSSPGKLRLDLRVVDLGPVLLAAIETVAPGGSGEGHPHREPASSPGPASSWAIPGGFSRSSGTSCRTP